MGPKIKRKSDTANTRVSKKQKSDGKTEKKKQAKSDLKKAHRDVSKVVASKVKEYVPDTFYDVSDQKQLMAGVQELLDGADVVVFRNVASATQVTTIQDLFWAYMKELRPSIDPAKPDTWTNANWPGFFAKGVFKWYGIGQSELMYTARTLPKVREVFEGLHKTSELFTSFDGCGVFRGGEHKVQGMDPAWLHVDQNRVVMPRKNASFQGALNLVPIPAGTAASHGSFSFVPGSNKEYSDAKTHGEWLSKSKQNYCPIPDSHPLYDDLKTDKRSVCVLSGLEAGDFVVWNSCTMHANLPPLDNTITGELRRLVLYVALQPLIEMKTDQKSKSPLPASKEELIQNKRLVASNGWTTSHWPCQVNMRDNLNPYPRHESLGEMSVPDSCLKTKFTESELCLIEGRSPAAAAAAATAASE